MRISLSPKMFKVKRFFCFSLETGGLIIGWAFAIVTSTILLIVFCVLVATAFDPAIIDRYDMIYRKALIVYYVCVLISFFGIILTSIQLIKGVKERDSTKVWLMMIISGIVAGLVILGSVFFRDLKGTPIGIVIGIIFFYQYCVLYSLRQKFMEERSVSIEITSPPASTTIIDSMRSLNYQNTESNYDNSEMEIDESIKLEQEDLELVSELGSGNFGVVFKGRLKAKKYGKDENLDVAVKTTHDNATMQYGDMLLHEANTMRSFNTKHLVRLLGIACIKHQYFMVMEFMLNGDLKSFLMKHPKHEPTFVNGQQYQNQINPPTNGYEPLPSLKQTLPSVAQMAIQIADGMAYLNNKQFIHRDLAARNCMVSEDLTIKIGDFGMTRELLSKNYYRIGCEKLVPVKWMAPESLTNGVFTFESDVFSYGIVLWEIVTNAEQPYKEMSNYEARNFIRNGGTETRPEQNCSDKIYDLMKRCWKFHPAERITFTEIIEELIEDAPKTFSEDSFFALRNRL